MWNMSILQKQTLGVVTLVTDKHRDSGLYSKVDHNQNS